MKTTVLWVLAIVTVATGDFDWNQVVDQADLHVWQAQFGTGGAALTLSGTGVPEPASFGIALLGCFPVLLFIRSLRHHS